ncbi:hypothetical protein [Nostoc sp. TCL240-02]|uniref:hypothetical protein n=1 Tax=Nostoc sp. TCL240-02 TaxID=2572090 RepID=UPI00157F8E22|nr:hypothetical protein [Nostoc sp. TCL240-02]QKQ74355.1 hypothetical protein FBB35_14395 [Nostoc sp. TCL240-02]
MFFTKDRNFINENSGIKASLLSSKKSNIFDNQNTDSSFSLSGVNSFRASDRISYTSTEIDAFGGKNNYANKSSHNGNATQAIATAIQPDLIARTVSTCS